MTGRFHLGHSAPLFDFDAFVRAVIMTLFTYVVGAYLVRVMLGPVDGE